MRLFVSFSMVSVLLALSLSGCAMSLAGSARTYEEKGDYNMAIMRYEKLARSESQQIKRLDINIRLARIYARLGQFNTAQARFDDALAAISELPEETIREVLPCKPGAEFRLALNALRKGNYKRCIFFLENVLLTEDAPDIHYYLSIAYKNQSKNYLRSKSAPTTQNLTTPSQEFQESAALVNQGRELARQGDTEEAMRKFELALERAPGNGSALNNYEKALVLLKADKYAEAIRLFLEMSETADVNYYLGTAYQAQARASAQRAIQWLETEKKEETREDTLALYEDAIEVLKSNITFP